jgi:hypothetical protein
MRYFFLMFIFYSVLGNCSVELLMPTDKLPRELIYLTESMQEIDLKDRERVKANDKLFLELEMVFRKLTKEELYFISKSELYKTALAFKPPLKITEKYYSQEIISEIEEKLKTTKLNSFSHWLIGGILKDLNNLFESRHFPSFINERNKGALTSGRSRTIQKKMNFLLPWLQSFMNEETALFEHSLRPLMLKTLKKIHVKANYLLDFSKSNLERKVSAISYFNKQDLKLNKDGKSSTVEDILDPLLSGLKNKNLPIPVDDWVDKDDEFTKGLTPLPVLRPTGNYTAPKNLPVPAEEW